MPRSRSARISWMQLPCKEREHAFPALFGRGMVVAIARGKRVAVLRAGMRLDLVRHLRRVERCLQRFDVLLRNEIVVAREAEIQLAIETFGEAVRRIRRCGPQLATVKRCHCGDALRKL